MNYIAFLADAIHRLHGAKATHVETVPIVEQYQGHTLWDGEVEVFDLERHPVAPQCFAWGYSEPADEEDLKAITVLSVPPITDPRRAVQAYIASLAKGGRNP